MSKESPIPDLCFRFDCQNGMIGIEQVVKGITTVKKISYANFVQIMMKSMDTETMSSGLLPENCISYAKSTENRVTVTLLYPERWADITYYDEVFPNFPLPRLVFQFRLLLGGRIETCRLGVIGEGQLRPDLPMYRYPFSNVYGNDTLCTGSNSMPRYDNLFTLTTLPQFILSMPNNDDYTCSVDNCLGFTQAKLMQYLKNKEPDCYYKEILIPNGKTLQDFIAA